MLPVNTHSRLIHSWIYLAVVPGKEGWRAAPLAGDQNESRKYRNYKWDYWSFSAVCCKISPPDSPQATVRSTWLAVLPIWGALPGPFGEVLRLMSESLQAAQRLQKCKNPKPWSHGNGGQVSGHWEVLGLKEFEIGGIPLSPGRMTKYQHGKVSLSAECPYIQWAALTLPFPEVSRVQGNLKAKTMEILLSPSTEMTNDGLESLKNNSLCFDPSLHMPRFWQCHTPGKIYLQLLKFPNT